MATLIDKKPVSWPVRAVCQLSGKVRRLFINRIRPGRVSAALSKRAGECTRCGACCRLLFHCPYLDFDEQGLAVCEIYDKRPINCRIFPLDARDMNERDMVPGIALSCGYRFDTAEAQTVETRSGEAAD